MNVSRHAKACHEAFITGRHPPVLCSCRNMNAFNATVENYMFILQLCSLQRLALQQWPQDHVVKWLGYRHMLRSRVHIDVGTADGHPIIIRLNELISSRIVGPT
jgi:hypothetical protein